MKEVNILCVKRAHLKCTSGTLLETSLHGRRLLPQRMSKKSVTTVTLLLPEKEREKFFSRLSRKS